MIVPRKYFAKVYKIGGRSQKMVQIDVTPKFISFNSVNWDKQNGGFISIIGWIEISTNQRAVFFRILKILNKILIFGKF